MLRHEAVPGRVKSFEVDGVAAALIALVDGKRTIGEIAELRSREAPPQTAWRR